MRIANIAALENSKSHRPRSPLNRTVVCVQYLLHQYSATLPQGPTRRKEGRKHSARCQVVGEVRFFLFLVCCAGRGGGGRGGGKKKKEGRSRGREGRTPELIPTDNIIMVPLLGSKEIRG